MSFLEINGTQPSVKRPFRVSDLQDLWNGITSLFKPIKGEQFRIISGFNIEGTTYSAGAVFYNGQLYEYDGSKPITSSTPTVYFAKVAVDTRQFDNGNSYPFAYKYVCGGSSFELESGYVSQLSSDTFRANIPKYKSYLGVGSVTTDKLADAGVTTEKLANRSVTETKLVISQVSPLIREDLASKYFNSGVNLLSSFFQGGGTVRTSFNATSGIILDVETGAEALPNTVVLYVSKWSRQYPETIEISVVDKDGGEFELIKFSGYDNFYITFTKVQDLAGGEVRYLFYPTSVYHSPYGV